MENKWNKLRYLVSEVAQKLCCEPVDIIQYGTLNKLRIAAYIHIEKEKVVTHYLSEIPYDYSSGIYYVHHNKLMHFEFVTRIDDIEQRDIISIKAYKDDHNLFYLFNGNVDFDFDKSMFNNIGEEVEYIAENYDGFIPDYESDLYDESDNETDLSLDPGDLDYSDFKKPINSEAGLYYTIFQKDLLVLHDDLICFFKNEARFHKELNAVKENNGITLNKQIQNESIQNFAVNKGGKPKGTLAEAIEHAYKKLRDEGKLEILREGKPREFLARLKEMASEGNPNEDKYIVERIKQVNIPKVGDCTVLTQERRIRKNTSTRIDESRTYTQTRISQILIGVRKK